MNKITSLTMHTGNKIPQLAFGTYKVKGNDTKAIFEALKLGYRHIDDAPIYQNEKDVGQVLKKSGIQRQQLFVTSKVWPSHMSKQGVLKSVKKSLSDLGLSYLDLLLIHWPSAEGVDSQDGKKLRSIRLQVWNTFIDLKNQGILKDIGVSNFQKKHLEPLLDTKEKPVVNQLMLNPYFVLQEQVQFCKKNNILISSWSPLARAGHGLIEDPTIGKIAKKHQRSPAQICLRWNVQHGNIVLAKSITPTRIQQNMHIFDFELTQGQMKQIDSLHKLGKMKPYERMLCE